MDATSAPRRLSPVDLVIDTVLTAVAFGIFFWLAGPHVPSEQPLQIALWSAYAAACMSGVFWLALQMFKSVFRHQRAVARGDES